MERWTLREEGEAEQRGEWRGGEAAGPGTLPNSRAGSFRAAGSPEVLPGQPRSLGRGSDSPAAGLSEPRPPSMPSLLPPCQTQGLGTLRFLLTTKDLAPGCLPTWL